MNEEMVISPDGRGLTKISEGLRLAAYPDPLSPNGLPATIAYGHTKGVYLGQTCTPDEAEQWLDEDLQEAYQIIAQWVMVPLTQCQFDGVADFIYNLGPGAPNVKDGFVWLRNGNHSSMLRKLNAHDYVGASNEFRNWANPPSLGLRIRRERERVLFTGGNWRAVLDNKEPW